MPDQGNVPDVNVLVIASLALATLVIAGAVALGARRARLAIVFLSALAIVLLGVADVLGRRAVLAILHSGGQIDMGTEQGIRAAYVLVQMAPFAVGAAWVLGLLVTARARQWSWFAAILIFPLITPLLEQLLYMLYAQTPGAGYGSASGQFICADVTDLCGFVPLAKQLPFIAVPLLTPLVTLIYGIAGPQGKPDVIASNAAADTAE
jgi:hypothetical protein